MLRPQRIRHLLYVLGLGLPLSALALDALEELRSCARISADGDRISCFEELGKRALETDAEPLSPPAASVASAAPVAMPDDLGGEEFVKKKEENPVEGRGRVMKCTQAVDKKWFYHFENGQVWKQVDSRRRRHRECDFDVTIVKDGFGYKMQIDGEKGKIRISRKR